jgi:hypothetical protein
MFFTRAYACRSTQSEGSRRSCLGGGS